MIGHMLATALRGLRSNGGLTFLMVLAIGLGIGFFMTILTIAYSMAKNPIPHKSDILYAVQIDSGDPQTAPDDSDDLPFQLTYIDAMALMDAAKGRRQFATTGTNVVVVPDDPSIRNFHARGRGTFADFFEMFDMAFEFGGAWAPEDDANSAQVVVLSKRTNDKLFGGDDSVGRTITLDDDRFVVRGVLAHIQPALQVYDVRGEGVAWPPDVFLPFNTMIAQEYSLRSNTRCWKPVSGEGQAAFLASECVWIQFWVELHTELERVDYLGFLNDYVAEQKHLGRLGRPTNNKVRNVHEWLDYLDILGTQGMYVLSSIAALFLIVCLINTLALLLAKFVARSKDVAIRRALGASKGVLFSQYTTEAAAVGVVGGLFGICFTWMGLVGIRTIFEDPYIAFITRLDLTMLVTAIVISICATVATALYPTWRVCSVQPVTYLNV